MRELIKTIHMYVGLLNFTILIVFGIAGLSATFEAETLMQQKTPPDVRYEAFTPRANASDKETADAVFQTLQLPLTTPVPLFAIRRNPQHELALDFYTVSAIHRVTVLEKENRMRIESRRNNVWRYLNNMHAFTKSNRNPDLRLRLWGWYTELSIWSLIGMSVSGVYLWLASRPNFRWAQISFAAGSLLFIILYVVTR